ncbi:hypothetical protein D3C80_1261660 [compost metagenome]
MPWVHSQPAQPLVSMTRPSSRRRRNSPVSSLILIKLFVRRSINSRTSSRAMKRSFCCKRGCIVKGISLQKCRTSLSGYEIGIQFHSRIRGTTQKNGMQWGLEIYHPKPFKPQELCDFTHFGRILREFTWLTERDKISRMSF